MQVFTDETEFTDIHMMQRVVGMFQNHPNMQRIIKCGLLGIEYDEDLDVDDYDSWTDDHHSFHCNSRSSRNLSQSSYSVYQHRYTSPHNSSCPPSVKLPAKESDSERKARLLQEAKTSKEKAEKKRLKKRKQKERKRMEKGKNVEKDDQQQCKAEDNKEAFNQKKSDATSNVKLLAAAKDADSNSKSSGEELSDEDGDDNSDLCDSEELDMTSTFVSKAALIAKRKLENSRVEKKEKKKIPDKEECKRVPDKPNEDKLKEEQKKDSAVSSRPTFEDNVKISTDLAIIGNNFAMVGDYSMAVKYFTDAIKYNPTEFKLFGNRSFCFEKLQEYEKALTDAELSLGINPGWVKGLFRKGRALAGLKRYEEAAKAFMDVLKLESSYAEAAQELMRVQIIQLMEHGFTREESSNALIIHGTVNKALEVLSRLHSRPGAGLGGSLVPAQVANVTGVSPVLSANTKSSYSTPAAPAKFHDAPINKPQGPVQNRPNVPSPSKSNHANYLKTCNGDGRPPLELFPIWVGNLTYPVTESTITNLFSKAGDVYSVKVLQLKRCAFVNFTRQEHCDEAIRRYHGYELNGMKIAVRYPDRIPPGMGISKTALKADNLQDENPRQNVDGRDEAGNRRPFRPYKPVPDHRGNN